MSTDVGTDLSAVPAELAGPASSSAAVLEGYASALMQTFGTPKRVFVRGEGCYVWDAEGRRHLDLLAGIAVNALGHAHPTVLSAVTGQIATLGHVSNFFATPAQVALAQRLAAMVEPDGAEEARVFFTNSGTEANEAAFKLTRMTGRTRIIACEGAFHGRSMGALALTHNPKYRAPFEPLPGDVVFVPYGDAAALAAELDDTVAAVVLEPVQGENGIVVPPAGYLARARQLCDAAGALLWVDEVQTGMGRTGSWLASVAEGVRADVVTMAKGLGNGFPIGACVARGRAAALLPAGSHGSTFGGNPVAAAAALAVLDTIEADGLMDNARKLGERLRDGLVDPRVTAVRARGLLVGLDLDGPWAGAVARAALAHGFIVNDCTPSRVRLAPPLVLTEAQVEEFLAAWPTILDDAQEAHA
jgi:acetylornithine aminotransferase